MLPQVVNRKGQSAAAGSWNQAAAGSWNQAAADSWNDQAPADSWSDQAAADSWSDQAAADSWSGQVPADSWSGQAAADSQNGQAAAAAAADSYYSNPGILQFHNHMDQQNQGMMHSHCNLVIHLLLPHSMNQMGVMLHLGHPEHFSWVAVSGNHIDKWKWNQEESHSGWSCDPPGEWSMIWLQTQLLEENKMFVLGLHQLRVDSEKKNTNYVNFCSNQANT